MSGPDAIVIGAGLGGLAAAACLTAAGRRVLVLERAAAPPEPVGPPLLFDRRTAARLRLSARGLPGALAALPMALPGPGAALLTLEGAAGALLRGGADADAWSGFRREQAAIARRLAARWNGARVRPRESGAAREKFARAVLTGADAWLRAQFESDLLIAALLFDATAGGLHVSEPGSVLALAWAAAGEGIRAAPDALVWPLIKAAAAAQFRCCAPVARILVRNGAAAGVTLAGGEEIAAPVILSSLSRAETARLAGEAAAPAAVGEARLLLSFRAPIGFAPLRLIVASHGGVYADAFEAARAGRVPQTIPMEFTPLDWTSAGTGRLAVTLRPVPAVLSPQDRARLAAYAVASLSRRVSGCVELLRAVRFARAGAGPRLGLDHMLAPAAARIGTPVEGLFLCGREAEPLPGLAGGAARIAAGLALKARSGNRDRRGIVLNAGG